MGIELNHNNPTICYKLAIVFRDNLKDYEKSQKYYLKCLEMEQKAKVKKETVNGSCGYLLYLMSEYEEAMKHILLGFKEEENSNGWTYYYHALVLNVTDKQKKAEESLKKAVESLKHDENTVINHLKVMKAANDLNQELHEQFGKMIVTNESCE